MSLYHILGVDARATIQDITRAYRALSIEVHPDRNKGTCTADFQKIRDAYDLLTDPVSRQTYDESSACLSRPTADPKESIVVFRERTPPNDPPKAAREISGDIDAYRPFTNRGCLSRAGHSARIVSNNAAFPEPVVVIALLSLEQCYLGCSLPITVTRRLSREASSHSARTEVSLRDDLFASTNAQRAGCFSRSDHRTEDSSYRGEFVCSETETITTYFPQGVCDKDIIVLEGFGDSIDAKGDVKVVIQVKPDPVFSVYGLDLVFQKHLTLKEALCGFSFSQLHPCGKRVVVENITMPSVVYPGYRRTMVGMGMIRDGTSGNMVVEFIVDFPQRLCSEQIRAIAAAL